MKNTRMVMPGVYAGWPARCRFPIHTCPDSNPSVTYATWHGQRLFRRQPRYLLGSLPHCYAARLTPGSDAPPPTLPLRPSCMPHAIPPSLAHYPFPDARGFTALPPPPTQWDALNSGFRAGRYHSPFYYRVQHHRAGRTAYRCLHGRYGRVPLRRLNGGRTSHQLLVALHTTAALYARIAAQPRGLLPSYRTPGLDLPTGCFVRPFFCLPLQDSRAYLFPPQFQQHETDGAIHR